MGGLVACTLLAFRARKACAAAPVLVSSKRGKSIASAPIVAAGRIRDKKQPDLMGLALRASQIVASWQLLANGTGHGRKDVI
jgi:hypothetical protein